jgi:hypothetical protein
MYCNSYNLNADQKPHLQVDNNIWQECPSGIQFWFKDQEHIQLYCVWTRFSPVQKTILIPMSQFFHLDFRDVNDAGSH